MRSLKIIFFIFSLWSASIHSQNNDTARVDINRIKIALNNLGEIGNFYLGGNTDGARFEEETFLYSTGFFISGLDNGNVWTNGVFPSAGIFDYLPGKCNTDPNDSRNKIYVLHSDDEPFGVSWVEWKQAVDLGASYYDGNGDDLYIPVDINGNGQWDYDEDRPDLLGDITLWNVINDDMNANEKIFSNVAPKGIEVQQTFFAWDSTHEDYLNNSFFIRYKILNAGLEKEKYDSVYFSYAVDPDIGNYRDDQVFCNPRKDFAGSYNQGPDKWDYGDNPPSIIVDLLMGAQTSIPGETYIDNNYNNTFDEEDTPLDSAGIMLGQHLGEKIIPGFRNLNMTSFIGYQKGIPGYRDPVNEVEARNYMLGGRWPSGQKFTVGSFVYGNGDELGTEADTISPNFLFSGNPVTGKGWLSNNYNGGDFRAIISSGPFELKTDEPVELLAAFTVGRGNDPINSIVVAENLNENIQEFFNANFKILPVDVSQNPQINIDFKLNQNYPNPFNSETTITFTLKYESDVKLIIYDILGREVETVLNQRLKKGNHLIKYDSSADYNIKTSGVYFYTLFAHSFAETRKFILLK